MPAEGDYQKSAVLQIVGRKPGQMKFGPEYSTDIKEHISENRGQRIKDKIDYFRQGGFGLACGSLPVVYRVFAHKKAAQRGRSDWLFLLCLP